MVTVLIVAKAGNKYSNLEFLPGGLLISKFPRTNIYPIKITSMKAAVHRTVAAVFRGQRL